MNDATPSLLTVLSIVIGLVALMWKGLGLIGLHSIILGSVGAALALTLVIVIIDWAFHG